MSDASSDFSARVASMFIRSKLTPLIMFLSLALGILATFTTAREEDPSVTITVADVFVAFPGRGAADVDERIARPVAAWILELPSVEHVTSSATDDGAMFVVQFREGIERDVALSQLYERLNANRESLPAQVPAPLVVPRGIEDVPVLAVTLWHETTTRSCCAGWPPSSPPRSRGSPACPACRSREALAARSSSSSTRAGSPSEAWPPTASCKPSRQPRPSARGRVGRSGL